MIEIKNIDFEYSQNSRGGLKQFSLTVQTGECLLLCGESGCGKTTVTRLINGLIPYFYEGKLSGEVIIDGENIANLPMYKISEKVGSVFQNPRTQFFNADTDSEIAFGLENEALPPDILKKSVDSTVKELHIEKLSGRNIFELSGGEKQQIAFASVYAMNPDIYLLDEPSSNLDAEAIARLKEHLRLIKAQGKTIIISEHRLYYLMELADKIIYLKDGRIQGTYTPGQLKKLSSQELAAMGLRAPDLNLIRLSVGCKEKEEAIQASSHSLPQTVFSLEHITVQYKNRIILNNISFCVSPGEIIGIAGKNGAGKTTLSKAICGLYKNSSGRFLWSRKPQSEKERLKNSYMVLQDVNYQLFAESVSAECIFGIKNPDTGLAERTLSELNLSDFKDCHPNTLSGGQKQRTAVAVSMVCQKNILIFDEPTSGLDLDSMRHVAKLIQKLAHMGKIIFIVTHDYEFVCRTCTRILYFSEQTLTEDIAVCPENEQRLKTLFLV